MIFCTLEFFSIAKDIGMPNQRELLAEKGREIQRELAQWVQEVLQLEPDEQLTITLGIERAPLLVKVPQHEGPSILDTLLVDFFSRQRCMDIVGDPVLATRVRRRLTHDEWVHGPDLKTVGDLIVYGKRRLLEIHEIGKGIVDQIERMLASEGLKLDL